MENPTFILMGGTGDLAREKLIPSLYRIFEKNKLEDFDIVATSRRDWTVEDYIDFLSDYMGDKERWEEFCQKIKFSQLDFYNDNDYKQLAEKLSECSNHRIFYLSTMPSHFDTITENLAKHDLVDEDSKVMYEKPFGHDLQTAKELNKTVQDVFKESQVYRVDHYLDKELIGNIATMRFTNIIIEPVWNSKYIDNVQVIMSEKKGIGTRGEFYDAQGTIKDVFQNHLLQLFSLAAMEEPDKFNAEEIRDKKVEAIEKASVEDCITGQYEGYRETDGVDRESDTETFAAMKLSVDSEKWEGVPFYLVSGKNLEKNEVKVFIEFKDTPCKLFEGVCPLTSNNIIISIKPEQDVILTINTKVPGEYAPTTSTLDLDYDQTPNTPKAYENLLMEAVRGRQISFVRSDEIEAQWEVIEGVEKPKPFTYEKGTFPREARDFIRDDGRSWYRL